ncbi:LysR family transcriptional regulator, partial [Variovorax paradoxus]|uniref:LysR family transcriptional regulator n=1 Tax=Variovorax paradoxus TaxID=34073 RepID=UPI00247A2EF5
MNLQQLEHLLVLAETGSFSRASEKVHLTQPALSRSIQMLEQELGMPLIDRIGKRNELTPFGAMVLDALGKPNPLVPFIMPKREAETPADRQIEEMIG